MVKRYMVDKETGEVHRADHEHHGDMDSLTTIGFHNSQPEAVEWVKVLYDSGQRLCNIRPTPCEDCSG
jgi:hypothetical protein